MIDDILACSRAERAETRCQVVDLNSLVAEVVAEARHLWPYAGVVVGSLPRVTGDACMLRQIFANLVGNALKFSSGRSDARVEIDARADGGITEIRIRDNGAGFDPAHAGKLFGLFQRLHTESEFPGTGVCRFGDRQKGGVAAWRLDPRRIRAGRLDDIHLHFGGCLFARGQRVARGAEVFRGA